MKRFRMFAVSTAILGAMLAAGHPCAADDVGHGPRNTEAVPGAQASSADSGDADQDAARWLHLGNKAFREGRFVEAESAYREAWTIKKGYDIAGNLGMSELVQHKYRDAAQHLFFTLRSFPITGEPALRTRMQDAFDQARREVSSLSVSGAVVGTHIFVDGRLEGDAPIHGEVFLDRGDHTIEARLNGYEPVSQRVVAQPGIAVAIALVQHSVPTHEAPPAPVLPKRRSLVPGLLLSGVAAVGVGGGIAFLGIASGKRADAVATSSLIVQSNKSCLAGESAVDSRCPSLQDTAASYVTLHNVGVGTLVVGSAAAVAAGVYFLWPSRRAKADVLVTPIVGAHTGGVVLEGSF